MNTANNANRRNEKPIPSDGDEHMPSTCPVMNNVCSHVAVSLDSPILPATSLNAMFSTASFNCAATAASTIPNRPIPCRNSIRRSYPGLPRIS